MPPIVATIFNKITDLEQQIQKLKIQAYFSLPKKKQAKQLYQESQIAQALEISRKQIWQKKYAKKIKSIS